MFDQLIAYFAKRHLLANLLFVGVLIGGAFSWQTTNKEEMPSIVFDTVRISARYPGAPASDVEYFVTRPIEEEIRSLDGVFRVTSSSSVGQANISVELDPDLPNLDEVIAEIRNEVLDVSLPDDVIDDPNVRVFRTNKKAILDIALIHKQAPILTPQTRRELQKYAFALENQLMGLSSVDSVNRSGYLQEEIQIKAYPERLSQFEIPFNTVMREIRENHVRQPAGTLEAAREPKVTLLSELNTPEKLQDFIIQGGFEGNVIRLGEVAEVESGYEKNETIYKVNGHEAVMFNVVKAGSVGILDAMKAVTVAVDRFKKNNLASSPVDIVLLDDESFDVRNRLKLIASNGAIGFVLILITLFIFLSKRSGIWVAMGIPFSLCFTIIFGSLMGHTINGTTLAAVIIVMGIVVDDAIVVVENITRLIHQGMEKSQAIVKGTSFVMLPIIASVTTTCVAFVPLFFFDGRFGKLIAFIPPIIFLMLLASLIESIFILPGHMDLELPFMKRFSSSAKHQTAGQKHTHWFDQVEDKYESVLNKLLPAKWIVFGVLVVLLGASGWLVTSKMKYVMFPDEETRDIVLSGETPQGFTRYETAEKVREVEELVIPYLGQEVVAFRTQIARSRRGGAVQDNRFRTTIEIVAKEQRKKSADQLIEEFKAKFDTLEGFEKLTFAKSRWGQDSGSPIEVIIQENNDTIRHEVAVAVAEQMREIPELKGIEIDEGHRVPEYRMNINREKVKRLAISPGDISSTFRAALEGTVLYEFSNGDEEVRVRLSTVESAKDEIEKVLQIPVENRNNYLVPLKEIVTMEEVTSPNVIARRDLKRTTIIDADIKVGSKKTPLNIADYLEAEVFPKVLSEYPSTRISFGGEVFDTRESKQNLMNAVVMATLFIFAILAILFNSMWKPLVIMLAIPFGVVGVILAFYLHGKTVFGFYAVVGALGLAGVVINDSIVMLVKLESELKIVDSIKETTNQIAAIAKTRLRAVLLTTVTTVVGVLPTAYGIAGYDAMLADMMLALSWGMVFGTIITLILIPCVYSLGQEIRILLHRKFSGVAHA